MQWLPRSSLQKSFSDLIFATFLSYLGLKPLPASSEILCSKVSSPRISEMLQLRGERVLQPPSTSIIAREKVQNKTSRYYGIHKRKCSEVTLILRDAIDDI